MKIIVLAGTRPELIRLNRIINDLEMVADCVCFIYTNQNSDPNLSDQFFKEFSLPAPNHVFPECPKKEFGSQVGFMFMQLQEILDKYGKGFFEKALILGDTNSSLCSIVFERNGIPVYHMEAGNRCYNRNSPEEINRRVIDHTCSFNLPYTSYSKENLISEGIHHSKIFITGNPIVDCISSYLSIRKQVSSLGEDEYNVLQNLKFVTDKRPDDSKRKVLCTVHRDETVRHHDKFANIVEALNFIGNEYDIIFPVHPKTLSFIKYFSLKTDNIILVEPVNFGTMIELYKISDCVLTDSGTVQEECCLLSMPCLILRDYTERKECIETGNSMLTGTETKNIIDLFYKITNMPPNNSVPDEYKITDVSTRVIKILMGVNNAN